MIGGVIIKKINKKEFKTLLSLIKEEKGKIIFISALIFLSESTYVFLGYLNGALMQSAVNRELKEVMVYLLLSLLISVGVGSFISLRAKFMLQRIENRISKKISYMTYKKTLNLPAYMFEKNSSGEIINRITQDTSVLNNSFIQLIRIFTSLIGSIFVIFYIFYNSWIVGLEIIFFVLILYFIIKKYNPLLEKINKDKKETYDKFSSLSIETVRGIREIKTLGVKENILKDMKHNVKLLYKKSLTELEIREKFEFITDLTQSLLEFTTFFLCAILLCYKKIDLSFFVAMTYYVYRYMWLIENINSLTQTYDQVAVSMKRINEILEEKLAKEEKYGDKVLSNVDGLIEFKNVEFNYPNEEVILKNFNLKVEPHKKVAIVGKSGQGKSTIFNLLTRVFDATSGEITLDGINIKDLTEETLRKQISIIRQEPFIFNKTIKENFMLVNDKLTIEDIRKYTKSSYLDDYIMGLPKQYDTILGEGGVNLSGGQKQRLAIARTLAKESKVILFDEATSALDNESQEYIKKTIDELSKNYTVIIVAHRLSTIIDADIIYVMDKGKIVDEGTHKYLLENSKIYKNLYLKETT